MVFQSRFFSEQNYVVTFIICLKSFSFSFVSCQDCRAGLNFCDELEAYAFRAAVKERIKDFKRKRQGWGDIHVFLRISLNTLSIYLSI